MPKEKCHKFWDNIHKLSVAQDKEEAGPCIEEWTLIDHYQPIILGHCVCNAKMRKEEYHYMNKKTGKHIVVGSNCRKTHGFLDVEKRKKGKGNITGGRLMKPVEYEKISDMDAYSEWVKSKFGRYQKEKMEIEIKHMRFKAELEIEVERREKERERKKMESFWKECLQRNKNDMATKIQSLFRGMKHRRVHGNHWPVELCLETRCGYCLLYYFRKTVWPERRAARPHAATKIQSFWRKLKAKHELKWRKTQRTSAIKIQSFRRMLKPQRVLKKIKERKVLEPAIAAAARQKARIEVYEKEIREKKFNNVKVKRQRLVAVDDWFNKMCIGMN